MSVVLYFTVEGGRRSDGREPGFEVTVSRDATATFERTLDGERFTAPLAHRTPFAHLNGEFATIAPVEGIVGDLERI